MNGSKLGFLILSLPAAAMLFPYSGSYAGLRISNSSLVKNQAQVNAERAAEESKITAAAAMVQTPQPARTYTDTNVEMVSVSNEDMNACNAIYPNGTFDWVSPTSGTQRGGPATCASYVELRSYKNAAGNSYTVLAHAYLAAGDSMKCNVDDFHDFTPAGRDFEYPADAAPTQEEVAAVMAQENKQNAGFKILAAAVVGGLGGNLLGKGEAGSEPGLGLGTEKLKTTALGAAGAAALMTASTQVNDYKTGTMILSTGVNAAAGAAAGNLMASGDDILKIDTCPSFVNASKDEICIYGTTDKTTFGTVYYDSYSNIFYDIKNNSAYKCESKGNNEYEKCKSISIMNIDFGYQAQTGSSCADTDTETKPNNGGTYTYVKQNSLRKCATELISNSSIDKYDYDPHDKNTFNKQTNGSYVKVHNAKKAGTRDNVVIKVLQRDLDAAAGKNKVFGYKYSDWQKIKSKIGASGKFNNVYNLRDTNAAAQLVDVSNFSPSMQSADDGDVIDFNNKARTKSTLIGAGGGAALGAISGAAGAEADIQERWLAAQREYEGSLGNIACFSGERYLSQYNSVIIMPEMKKEE